MPDNTLPVRKTKCATCPFRSEGWTHVRQLLEERALTEGTPICHSTGKALIRHNGERLKAHLCRGARDFQQNFFFASASSKRLPMKPGRRNWQN